MASYPKPPTDPVTHVMSRFLSTLAFLKPSATALGYALFLAINATTVWGGVFPFLPLEFQSQQILLLFFLSQATTFFLVFAVSATGSYFFPEFAMRFSALAVSVLYFLGWCCLIASIYLHDISLKLVVAGGLLLGFGSAGFYMHWQRVFAAQPPEKGTADLVLGTAYAALLYFALHAIPRAVTAFLIPLVFLPLFGLSLELSSRSISHDQPMFQDKPRENPRVYKKLLADAWRSALCIGTMGFCTGIMRSLAIAEPSIGSFVNIISMGASLAAATIMLLIWKNRRILIDVNGAYRLAFPFVITSLALLPLLPSGYTRWLAAFLYALHSVAILLAMVQCAQISRDRGINPVFIYGFFGMIIYGLHDIGFVLGAISDFIAPSGLHPYALVALVSVYLLSMMHFISRGGFPRRALTDTAASNIELLSLSGASADAPSPNDSAKRAASLPRRGQQEPAVIESGSERAISSGRTDGRSTDISTIDGRIESVRLVYGLSARETEVMEQIARGVSVARIAESLFISENTVRTHSKRIYAKLGVHKRQELRDLIDSF